MGKIKIVDVNTKERSIKTEDKLVHVGVDMVNGIVVRDLEEFETKESLEEYGLQFGINLNKKFSLDNMKKQLAEHIDSLR